MKHSLFLLCLILTTSITWSQEEIKTDNKAKTSFKITVKPKNYPGDKMQLAYHLANKQFAVEDAISKRKPVTKQSDGSFVFNGKKPLEPGMYMLVFYPEKNIVEFIITKKDQHIEINFDYNMPEKSFSVNGGSNENKIFFDYLIFLDDKKYQAEALKKSDANYNEKLASIRNDFKVYQQNIFKTNPNSFSTAIIKTNLELEIPKFEGSERSVLLQTAQFYHYHYFDNFNLADPRMLRTSILLLNVDFYVDKLHIQKPDSIAKALDYVLKKMEPAKETYKTYLIYFLNKYAEAEGMDLVYLHLVDEYYAKGKATWIEEEQLKKIIQSAADIKSKMD